MRGILVGLALTLLMMSCIVQRFTGPRITGTCEGACDHYVACKSGHAAADGVRCRSECPQVFSDPESLMGYESLSCPDAVEYVDGPAKKTAGLP